MIDIVENESLIKHTDEFDGILIGTNCYQVMRNGFQYEISQLYPEIKEVNYSTKYGDKNKLGDIINWDKFYLLFISFGYNFKGNNDCFLDYDALISCLKLINLNCKGQHLATTMIGCSQFDGNGDKQRVLDILNEELTKVDLTIFDYKQESWNTIHQKQYYNGRHRKKIN